MNPGTLNLRITIQSKTITQDTELNAIETWADFKTLWASAIPKTGREYYKLATVNSEIIEVFKVRYISGINPHQRVKFNSKYFEIIDVLNDGEQNKELLITCKAVV
jgi:SPP1 family predicted phage head-tail adaptor